MCYSGSSCLLWSSELLCKFIELCRQWSVVWGFFFFKQKTAYGMRISDWSSDVCSSDLLLLRKLLSHSLLSTEDQNAIAALPFTLRRLDAGGVIIREGERCDICPILLSGFAHRHKMTGDGGRQIVALKLRSGERRVGKECVSTCRFGWSQSN